MAVTSHLVSSGLMDSHLVPTGTHITHWWHEDSILPKLLWRSSKSTTLQASTSELRNEGLQTLKKCDFLVIIITVHIHYSDSDLTICLVKMVIQHVTRERRNIT